MEDDCKVWGNQSGVMQSFAATKERQTSWLGVGILEMAGQKNVCRNSYCLQTNLRVSLQFCQRQANCIAHCYPCLSSLLVVAIVVVCCYSFVHPFARLFIHSFIHLICLFVCLFVCVCLVVHHSFHLLVCSFIR